MKRQVRTALTIAGTDPTGGAGIQADLKTFQEREVFGMSVITSIVAQNTLGVQHIEHLSVDLIEKQLDSVIADIVPDAIKTGMIAKPEMMHVVADKIEGLDVPYVIDPVMVAKSGDSLMDKASQRTMQEVLIPLATVVTPNIPEAEILLGQEIKNVSAAEHAAKAIVQELGAKAAVITGGHFEEDPTDVLYDGDSFYYYETKWIDTHHTHGTGCTFSAALTAELAKGREFHEAVQTAKDFITDAIYYSLKLGKGNGPTNYWGHRLKGLPNSR